MADVPSRAVVIFGDGLVPCIDHKNLHALATAGCCGFLALRPPSDGEGAALIRLLDVHDPLKEGDGLQTMSERFMGMKAAMFTNSQAASTIGRQTGFSVTLQELDRGTDPVATASKFLGIIDPEKGDAELLLVHISSKNGKGDELVLWMDSLVGELMKAHEYFHQLLLVVVLGSSSKTIDLQPPSFDQELLYLRPRQSFSIKAEKMIDFLGEDRRLLAVYHQPGVTRRDYCQSLTTEEFQKNCGNLTILADRFLYELAFKLWKAPKYGA